jgi:hypothetical protein
MQMTKLYTVFDVSNDEAAALEAVDRHPEMQFRRADLAGWRINWLDKAQNVVDKPFEVRPAENVEGIVLTFTDRQTEVFGTLLDSANRPAAEYFVMMFSADRTLWTPRSRAVRAPVRADSTGQFTIAGLPAGDYYICALPDFDQSTLNDPSFLEQLVSGSIKISLADGEKRKQDMRLAGGR